MRWFVEAMLKPTPATRTGMVASSQNRRTIARPPASWARTAALCRAPDPSVVVGAWRSIARCRSNASAPAPTMRKPTNHPALVGEMEPPSWTVVRYQKYESATASNTIPAQSQPRLPSARSRFRLSTNSNAVSAIASEIGYASNTVQTEASTPDAISDPSRIARAQESSTEGVSTNPSTPSTISVGDNKKKRSQIDGTGGVSPKPTSMTVKIT